MSQQETNDWIRQETADFVTGTAADIASSTDPNLGKRLDFLHLYLKGAFVLGSLNKIDDQDWPDTVKTAIKMLVFAQTFGPVAVPSNIEMTFAEAWDAVHNLPEQHEGSLEYLIENFPNTFGEGPGDTLLVPEFLNWAGPGPWPGSVPPPGNPNAAPTPTPASPPVAAIVGSFGAGENAASPIVLDIDGSGTIELAALDGTGSVYWDIDQDGFAEASGWITGGDGLLCIDLNNDGVISDHGELFGGSNGYVTLAAYDTNSSGTITSADTDFGDLLVWVDDNADGFSQSGELHTLSSLGITSISTTYSTVNYAIAGNEIKYESTFVMNGNTYTSVDAFFNYDNVNTTYVGEYTLDSRTLFLPTLRGYGNLPDLHIAMSMDEDLLDMVEDFVNLETSELMEAVITPSGSAIQDILFRWAGVDGVNPTSRGAYIDARVVEFLEEFMGRDYLQFGTNPNPGSAAADLLMESWENALHAFSVRLGYQATGSNEWFTDNPVYDPISDTFGESTTINCAAIEEWFLAFDTLEEKLDSARYLAVIIDKVVGIENLTTQDHTDLESILPYGSINAFKNTITGSGDFDGDANDNLLLGSSSGDYIDGNGNNDILIGYEGNDSLDGDAGNDTLIGGDGADTLRGGTGDDTYVFAAGSGIDYLEELTGEGTDTIRLTGYATTDVRLWTNSGDLYIGNKANPADYVRIKAAVTGAAGTTHETDIANYVEQIVFDDTTTWNLADGLVLEGSSSTEIIYGSQYNDQIKGMDGNDTLYGNRGNDTLTGGAGADSLYGGTGNDTYIFTAGSGIDYLEELTGAGTDTIRLTGYATTDVRLWTNSGDLYIGSKANPSDYVRVKAAVTGAAGTTHETDIANYVEQIVFDDTTTWTLTDGLSLEGSSNSENMYGSQYNDQIKGMDGNDTLRGNRGNDTLIGGSGGDELHGGAGDDTYVFASGSGTDYLYENTSAGTDTIRLTGYATTDVRLSTTSAGSLIVTNKANGSDKVTIFAAKTGASGTTNETAIGLYVEQIVFDDTTTWNLTSGLALEGSSSGETLYGSQYNDQIQGMDGSDTLYGNRGDDTLLGENGNDTLYGGDGNDFLYGGASADTLVGGTGSDAFIFEAATAFGASDTITDFSTAQVDKLDVSDILSAYDPLTHAISDFIRITDNGTHSYLSVDADGGGNSFTQIAQLSSVTNIATGATATEIELQAMIAAGTLLV